VREIRIPSRLVFIDLHLGQASEDSGASPLNLTDFSRQRARLLFEFEF
jgi:hypothetical protein